MSFGIPSSPTHSRILGYVGLFPGAATARPDIVFSFLAPAQVAAALPSGKVGGKKENIRPGLFCFPLKIKSSFFVQNPCENGIVLTLHRAEMLLFFESVPKYTFKYHGVMLSLELPLHFEDLSIIPSIPSQNI